jgi:hypothetical protein
MAYFVKKYTSGWHKICVLFGHVHLKCDVEELGKLLPVNRAKNKDLDLGCNCSFTQESNLR